MKYEQLNQLNSLREKGAITEEEYQREKEKILNAPVNASSTNHMLGMDVNTYSMFIHLSQLCGFVVPLAGMVVPIVLWVINKDKSPVIDRHGKIVFNWIISSLIYFGILGLLCIILIGVPLIFLLLIANLVFIISGSIKAKSGEFYKYPLSIEFIKID